ncbi:MAG: carbohydrate ABC transporter permease [Caldilineaceae bacterium]|nr:carbohydrate ABC transporter permease [Caldilineaceae bacterium]
MSEFSWETLMLARLLRKSYDAVLFYLLLGIIIFLLLFPFYWGFITSLKYEVEIYDFTGNFLVPKNPSLDNYLTVFTTSGYFIWFWNTTLVSTVTTLISVVISIMAGFAIARLHFKGAALAGTLVFITYLAPKGFLFVPLAQILKNWGLLGGLPALMITYPTNLIPFCTWLLSGYFANLPSEPEECAMVDGASRIGAMVRITIPMAIPGIITAAIFSFTASWNELLYSIVFVSGEQNKMLTNGVIGAFTGGDWFSWGPLMAAATISSLPIAFLYLLFTDRFVSGITTGSTKG